MDTKKIEKFFHKKEYSLYDLVTWFIVALLIGMTICMMIIIP